MRRSGFSILLLCSMLVSTSGHAQPIALGQVLQQVMDHYPSLKTAAIQVERSRQEQQKVESQLGWMLGAQGGISRDVPLAGTTADRLNLQGNASRKLIGGETLSLDAGIRRDNASASSSPLLPNPSTTTTLDLGYRIPLARGAGNPDYQEGLVRAGAGILLADVDRRELYDQLASRLIELYMSAATTRARIDNTRQAITRTKRLQRYIQDREELGLSEEKDLLQVNAELSSRQAALRGLEMIWEQQRISLNRLMGKAWDMEIVPQVIHEVRSPQGGFDVLLEEVVGYSPDLGRIEGRLQLAESTIQSSRDAQKDEMDLVLFVGNETSNGDAAAVKLNESELVGGVRIEYRHGVDRRGYDAELYQAQLDRYAVLQDKVQIMEDLKYDLSSLLAEIKAGEQALRAYQLSVKSENAKLQEANQRYRAGRADTDQLIQFESQLAEVELALELQRVEIARRYYSLSLLRGALWDGIQLPEFTYPVMGE